MKFALPLTILLLAPAAAAQSTWYVDVSGVPPGTGSSFSPFTSIQYAIDQASTLSGDTILVRPGAYVESIDFAGKDLALRSTSGPSLTLISATPPPATALPVVSVLGNAGSASTLEGFTLTGGQPSDGRGGAILCEDALLGVVDCVVTAVRADGAAVWVEDSSVDLRDSTFFDLVGVATRYVSSDGDVEGCSFTRNVETGGPTSCAWLEGSQVSFDGCAFVDNESNLGVAIYAESSSQVELDGCTVEENFGASAVLVRGGSLTVRASEFTDNRTINDGGAALNAELATVLVEGSTFVENRAGSDDYRGGAFYAAGSDVVVRDSIFLDNFSARGGGAYTDGGTALYERCWFEGNRAAFSTCCFGGSGGGLGASSSSRAERCVFVGNRAEGFGFAPAPDPGYAEGWGGAVVGPFQLVHCTLVDNWALEGGGAWEATLESCIVRGNEPDQLAGSASATFSNVEGGASGSGNLDAPAGFVNATGNYHLAPGSPCIDAGDRNAPPDLDGSRADQGAFQFVDCNGNGVVDAQDIQGGFSADQNGNAFPDECECIVQPYCVASPHSAGPGARMTHGGSASVSANDLVLVATDCPPGHPGLFFYGTDARRAAVRGRRPLRLRPDLPARPRPDEPTGSGDPRARQLQPAAAVRSDHGRFALGLPVLVPRRCGRGGRLQHERRPGGRVLPLSGPGFSRFPQGR